MSTELQDFARHYNWLRAVVKGTEAQWNNPCVKDVAHYLSGRALRLFDCIQQDLRVLERELEATYDSSKERFLSVHPGR